MPRELKDRSLLVARRLTELSSGLGRQPTVSELAGACGLDDERVLEALEASGAYRPTSLSLVRDDDEEARDTLGDTVGMADEGFDRAEDRATLDALLKAIPARDRQILRMRFEDDMTQGEIADWVGVSQMQVSRIIRRSVARLRATAETPTDGASMRAGRAAASGRRGVVRDDELVEPTARVDARSRRATRGGPGRARRA